VQIINKVAKLVEYLQDTVHELVHKVSWPTWTELQNNTLIVVAGSVIFSLIIFVMDFIFGVNPDDSFWRGVLGLIYP
jgi:preprotein translocase subunit SecE